METKQNIIALIPSYEPEEILVGLVTSLSREGYTVILVDDGSGPSFAPIFDRCRNYATLLQHRQNQGKGCAIKTALRYIASRPEYRDTMIITVDGDGQHSLADIKKVTAFALQHQNALVLGSRAFDENVPKRSQFGNSITRLVYRISTGVPVQDTQTGLRCFSADRIPFLLGIDGNRYEYEINVLLACSREKIPILEVTIQTIYLHNNSASHFHTIRDSVRVYSTILKFTASSFVSFLADYGLYSLFLLITAGLGALTVPVSNVIARLISATFNYTLNKKYVFQNKDSIVKTGVQYCMLAGGILIGNTIMLTTLTNVAGMNQFLAKLLTEMTFFLISWTIQKLVIFKKQGGSYETIRQKKVC